MKKSKIFKILILSILLIIMYYTKSYCVEDGTVRMKITGETVWDNINISEAYKECESLNSTTSTLGTGLLRAHLTTNADWSAMALFAVSQYGGATSNGPTWTSGNNSGLKGVSGYALTTGISYEADKNSNEWIYGLFNDDGSVKEYVTQWNIEDRMATNFVGFTDTWGWYGASVTVDNKGYAKSYPIFITDGLFGYQIYNHYQTPCAGRNTAGVSFWPVIWN